MNLTKQLSCVAAILAKEFESTGYSMTIWIDIGGEHLTGFIELLNEISSDVEINTRKATSPGTITLEINMEEASDMVAVLELMQEWDPFISSFSIYAIDYSRYLESSDPRMKQEYEPMSFDDALRLVRRWV